MKNKVLPFLSAVCALAASGIFFYAFEKWIPLLYGLSVVLFAVAAGSLTAHFCKRKVKLRFFLTVVIYAALYFALTFLINNVILKESKAAIAAMIISAVNLVFFLLFYFILGRGQKKKKAFALTVFVLCVVLTFCSMLPNYLLPMYYKNEYKYYQSPVAGVEIPMTDRSLVTDADLYVSPDGDDQNDGSFAHPLASPEKAVSLVRSIDKTERKSITVALKAGEYRVDSLVFTPEDAGTAECPVVYCAYGDGEVILNGGITLPHSAFIPASESVFADRFKTDAREKILSVDLFSLGVTPEQYGKIYAIGGYNQASRYDGDWVGPIWCELFVDDNRQTIARYPNGKEYLYTGDVVFEGEGRESASARLKPDYESIRNPLPDIYKMDKSLSDRIASWKTTEGVWMFGYWRYDWADGSTPLGNVDHENRTISPMFASGYGAKKDAPYYFFNVPEELDAPGEWYLDRDNGVLYFYPPDGFSEASSVELSLSTAPVIDARADHLTLDGLTIKGTRGDAVVISGDGNTVKNCLIKNIAGNALIMTGYGNLAQNNEITGTGKGGVILSGGDIETLTAGDNRAVNNLVHDWSEIYETYQPAFTLNGVGNVCSHNEMYNSPHEAVTYSGNNHLIEYNLIHDVNLLTDDGGAIYSGRRWDWYGTVIRYNLIYDLGADGHKPVGIYMDDALAGQTIYGNIIINAPNFGIQLGGGQDLDVHDNIVVNSRVPISFDDRALSGLSGDEESSFYQHYKENGELWKLLYDSPWQSEIWQKAFPQYQHYSADFANTDDPDFVLNPGHCSVRHNVLISSQGKIGEIADTVYKYSVVEENAVFRLSKLNAIFTDPAHGDYSLRDDAPIGFSVDVPSMNEFGRQPQ